MIHELSLSDYIDHGRATVREVGREAIWRQRRADAFYRLDRRSPRILGPLDCDCAACVGLEKPPAITARVRERDEGQLELPGV